jgi:3-dehydroquinate synthase
MSAMSERNILLTGFMGTGKTTVGRLLAARLGRTFVDMDEVLARRFDKPIPAIFAEDGEAAFRAAETGLLEELAKEHGLVIGTGGGALVDAHNREVAAATGTIVCLTAGEDAILVRLGSAEDRPLLQGNGDERRARLRTLLRQRRTAYAAIPHQVDTTGLTPEEVVARVLVAVAADTELPGLVRIPVQTPGQIDGGSYDLLLGDGILRHAGALLARRGVRPGPVAVVTNPMLEAHAATLTASLTAAGCEPHLVLAPEGEQHKTLDTVRLLYERFLAAGLDRRGAVVALGGGVIGDMAGFAAATYLRGVPFVQIPTTLLAMVDAAVGGKVGVDLPQGKNLVGAFKQPQAVVMDVATLATLPAAEFRAGLAEVVKHGIIGAPHLFAQLEEEGPASLLQLVADAVRVKVAVVEADPFESGLRAVLNLGHTFGHALELVSDFRMRHGEAVAVGLVAAGNLAAELGIAPPELAARIKDVVARLGLATAVSGYDPVEIRAAMGHDKKRSGKNLRFVVPRAIGDVIVIDYPGDEEVDLAVRSVVR